MIAQNPKLFRIVPIQDYDNKLLIITASADKEK